MNKFRPLLPSLGIVLSLLLVSAGSAAQVPWPPVATFSILGYDSATGEVGAAVQSRVFSVGNGVLWGEADVGVAATQAIVDVSYGPKAIRLLREGLTPNAVVGRILAEDPDPRPDDWTKEGRQFAVMNAKGDVAVHTGPKASTWAGHRIGKYCSAQGNILAGQAVVDNMVKAFEETEGHLSLRLLAALERDKPQAATRAACSLPRCSSSKRAAACGSTTTSYCASR